jgi:hypothetical protein
MTPEIATLARDVFWRENDVHLEPSYSPVNLGNTAMGIGRQYFAYPNPSVHQLITKLAVKLRLRDNKWDKLKKPARGDYGFGKLRYVAVKIDLVSPDWGGRGGMGETVSQRWNDFLGQTVGEGLAFR